VLENVLINAKEAMPDGGIVELIAENTTIGTNIRSVEQGNYVRLSLMIMAREFPGKILSRIFDSLFYNKKEEGTWRHRPGAGHQRFHHQIP